MSEKNKNIEKWILEARTRIERTTKIKRRRRSYTNFVT